MSPSATSTSSFLAPLRPLLVLALLATVAACGPGGSAPEMQLVDDQLVAVNEELVIVLSASDKDGDEVFYSFESDAPNIYSRASLNRLPVGVGEFRWTPQATDVGVWFFDFTASDGSAEDTISVRIEVRAAVGGNAAPTFLHPQGAGTTLDLELKDCLDLSVEIVDSDSTDVEIVEEEPKIEFASLRVESGLTASWNWCPTPEQIEADDRYTLLLSANDGENPKKLHPYLIVLRKPLKPDCPGEGPIVTHQATDLDTLRSIRLEAEISDDKGLKQEPLLYYSTDEPSNPPDLSQMIQVTMRLESGSMQSGTWSAIVPNPVVDLGQGASRTLYYTILADDDDDEEGDCDHLTRSPATGTFQSLVTNPGGNGNAPACEPCTADVQCGGANDLCVRVGNGSESFCLQDCAQSCPVDYECSASEVESVEGTSLRQCVPISQDCSDPGGTLCEDDEFENNDSKPEAEGNPVLEPGDYELVSCPAASGVGDDEDWFEVFLPAEGRIEASIAPQAGVSTTADLDLAIIDANGTTIDASQSLDSTEAVSACLPQGFYYLRVFAFGSVETPYDLSLSMSSETCEVNSCVDDSDEEDDNELEARFVDLDLGVFEDTDQQICLDDQDWFEVTLFNDELLSVELTFTQSGADGDLDIHFHDVNGVDLTPCSPDDFSTCETDNGQSGSSNESALFLAPSSGCSPGCTFYVVVQGFDGDENDYDIRMESAL